MIKWLFLILLLLRGFGLHFIEFPGLGLLFFTIYISIFVICRKCNGLFAKDISLFLLFIIPSVIGCRIFRGQGLYSTLMETGPYFGICIYFLLHRCKVNYLTINRVLVSLCILFCICYIVQFYIWPTVIFDGAANTKLNSEGNLRIRATASGLASLAYFMGLNKFMNSNRLSITNVVLIVLGFSSVIFMGFRTMAAGLLVVTFYLFVRRYGFSYKIISALLVSIGGIMLFFNTEIGAQILENMMLRQERGETLSNDDYIRWIQFDYFYSKHFINTYEMIFGSGLPALSVKSSYSTLFDNLDYVGINYYDWGIWGLTWVIGIPSVIFMTKFIIKAIFTKVSSEYYFISAWFIYLYIVSFTSFELPRSGNFLIQGIVLYYLDLLYEKNRNFDVSPC